MTTHAFKTAKQFINHMLQEEQNTSTQYRFISEDGFLITQDINKALDHGWGEYTIERIECKLNRKEMLYKIFVGW